MTRVVWTESENLKVARQAATLVATGVVHKKLDAMNKAMEVLPEGRRRPPMTGTSAGSQRFHDAYNRELDRLKKLPLAERKPEADKPAQPAPAQTQAAPAPQPQAEDLPPAHPVEDAIVEAVKRIAVRVLYDADIRSALVALLGLQPEQEVVRHDPRPTATAIAGKLPRVLVAGLIPPQITEIRAAYAGRIDLRFWTVDQKASDLTVMGAHCDLAIGCVGFMSHPAEKNIRKACANYVRNSNGVSSVRRILDEYLKTVPA